ncbi:hypothetical protein CROQUDRAFT_42912 [Cronartium quercuum f. sp. fusiforme G11]|uniref:Uncharacterized protein n=1 Tax=Cronartium quercuum f. sp. fusiforme G11 TaxID=708437 RepID=A0A9P6NNL0_9BASI|nr:hypothetical protein CROQUDRAFT_42912 [Cronartium quercuum f. sp. fusiforme G11]
MHRVYFFVLAAVFLSCAVNFASAGVSTRRTDTIRKFIRVNNAKRSLQDDRTEDTSIDAFDSQRMLEHQPDSEEHGFMMISATSGGSDSMFDGGQEGGNSMSIEMLVMDFGEKDGAENQARRASSPTIATVKSIKRILSPPSFPPTLRALQITDDTRAKADRLRMLADRSARESTDPFMKLVESLGAAMAAQEAETQAEASKTIRAEPAAPKASEGKLEDALPTVVQKAPQSQNTFTLSEGKSFDTYNTSHHSQL